MLLLLSSNWKKYLGIVTRKHLYSRIIIIFVIVTIIIIVITNIFIIIVIIVNIIIIIINDYFFVYFLHPIAFLKDIKRFIKTLPLATVNTFQLL